MTDAEYLATLHRLVALGRELLELDLAGFLERIQRAESLGPTLDPTLYRMAAPEMARHETVARALRDAQIQIERLRPAEKGGAA